MLDFFLNRLMIK